MSDHERRAAELPKYERESSAALNIADAIAQATQQEDGAEPIEDTDEPATKTLVRQSSLAEDDFDKYVEFDRANLRRSQARRSSTLEARASKTGASKDGSQPSKPGAQPDGGDIWPPEQASQNGSRSVHMERRSTTSGSAEDDSVHKGERSTTGGDFGPPEQFMAPERPRSIFGLPIIPAGSTFTRAWTGLIYFLDATYTGILLPILVGFREVADFSHWTGIVEVIAGCIFLADIFVQFHMSVIIKNGMRPRFKLRSGRTLARFYVFKGTFFADAISCLSLFMVLVLNTEGSGGTRSLVITIFRFLRFARVFRLVRALFAVDISSAGSKHRLIASYTFSLVYSIALLLNFLACFWYFLGTNDAPETTGWMAQSYKFGGTPDEDACVAYVKLHPDRADDVVCDSLWFSTDKTDRYLYALYYVFTTVTTVGYGDITPATKVETIGALLIMLVGLAAFGTLIGSVIELLGQANQRARRSSLLRARMTDVQSWMDKRKIRHKLQHRVARFYSDSWILTQDADEAEILGELPHSVRTLCVLDIVKKDLSKMELWSAFSDTELTAIAARLTPHSQLRGHDVISQGDDADAVYFLLKGEVEVLDVDKRVSLIRGPATLGEAALFATHSDELLTRMNGYRTTKNSSLWSLGVKDIKALSTAMPSIKRTFHASLRKHVITQMGRLKPATMQLVQSFLAARKNPDTLPQDLEAVTKELIGSMDTQLVQVLTQIDDGVTEQDDGAASWAQRPSRPGTARVSELSAPTSPSAPLFGDALGGGGTTTAGGGVPDWAVLDPHERARQRWQRAFRKVKTHNQLAGVLEASRASRKSVDAADVVNIFGGGGFSSSEATSEAPAGRRSMRQISLANNLSTVTERVESPPPAAVQRKSSDFSFTPNTSDNNDRTAALPSESMGVPADAAFPLQHDSDTPVPAASTASSPAPLAPSAAQATGTQASSAPQLEPGSKWDAAQDVVADQPSVGAQALDMNVTTALPSVRTHGASGRSPFSDTAPVRGSAPSGPKQGKGTELLLEAVAAAAKAKAGKDP